MKKINIREALLKLDQDSYGQYDLTTLYECCKLTDDDKIELVKYIDAYEHPSVIGGFLEGKCKGINENFDDDDITDIKDAEEIIKQVNDNDVDLFIDYDIDDEEHPVKEHKSLSENVIINDSDETRKYVWKKILPFDNLTDDSSYYWDFDQDVRDGLVAKVVSTEIDIPDSADYKFSMPEVGLNFYFVDRPEYSWYVLDTNYEAPVVEESVDIRACPICGRHFAEHELGSNGKCPKCGEHLHKTDSGEYELTDRDMDENYPKHVNLNETWDAYDPTHGWTEEDIALHKSIDWKARNYMPYRDETDTFEGEVTAYGLGNQPQKANVTFVKEFSPNPIYSPVYVPKTNPFEGTVGFMYDGNKHNGYLVMDRTETQKVYDMLSEAVESEYCIVAVTKEGTRKFYKDGKFVDDYREATIFNDLDEARSEWFDIDKSKYARVFVPVYDAEEFAKMNEAVGTLERPMSALKGTLSNVLLAHKDEVDALYDVRDAVEFLDKIRPEVKNVKYVDTVKSDLMTTRGVVPIQYLYNIILKGDGKGTDKGGVVTRKSQIKKWAREAIEQEKAYSKEEIEKELRSLTNNFTVDKDVLKCGFKEEAEYSEEILSKYYALVKVNKVGSWFQVDFKDRLKKGKRVTEVLDENEDESINDSKSINESADSMIYLFPELTDEDIKMAKAYGLQYLGKNHGADGSEDNRVVAGTLDSLNRYADKYLGYELHPDYLYNADDFAGDIVED